MNKNNFFVKFVNFYKMCFTGIISNLVAAKDSVIDLFEPLAETFVRIVYIVVHIFNIFVPIIPIILCFASRYMTKEELEKIGFSNKAAGYYTKKSIKKFGG